MDICVTTLGPTSFCYPEFDSLVEPTFGKCVLAQFEDEGTETTRIVLASDECDPDETIIFMNTEEDEVGGDFTSCYMSSPGAYARTEEGYIAAKSDFIAIAKRVEDGESLSEVAHDFGMLTVEI